MFCDCGKMLLLAGLTGCAAQQQLRHQNHTPQTAVAPIAAAPTTAKQNPLTATQVIPAAYEVVVELPDANTEAERAANRVDSKVLSTTEPTTVSNSIEDGLQPEAVGLTLDQVINTCLIADPKIRAGLEAINQANADALSASLKPNPMMGVSGTLMPLTRPFTKTMQGGPPQFDVGVAYPIDWYLFGKRAAAMVSSCLGVKVSEAEYADLVRQRVQEAAIAYYDVLEARALRVLARQDVANLRRVAEVSRKAIENGGRPQVELSRIRLDLLRSEQSLRESEAALVGAKARLRALLGRADADPTFDVAGSLPELLAVEPIEVEQAYALAEQNRPDVIARRIKHDQAHAQAVSEERIAYPLVTPNVGYTRQFQEKAIGFPDANSWGVGLNVSLPLFDRNQGNRAKAASLVQQTQFELQSSLVDLRAEVQQAVQAVQTARANAQAIADEQLQLADQVRDSMNKAFDAGGRPLLDVLDAQRNYRETYRLYIGSRANYWRASVKLNSALGTQAIP